MSGSSLRTESLRLFRVFISIGAVLIIWSVISLVKVFPEALFPSPWSVAKAFAELYRAGILSKDFAVSLSRAVVGFVVGAGLGIVIGVITGRVYFFRTLMHPFLSIMRPIPAIALAPVAIVWFGIGEESKYFIISYTVFLSVWFNTHIGIEFVPSIYLKVSKILGVSKTREFFTVILPAAAPHISTGLRLGASLSLLSLVAAELTGASSGIGYRLQEARQYIRTDWMFAQLIELGVLGALVDTIFSRIAKRVVHWEQVS
ncbi:MAG: ABC transporter permease [Synergistaceae bacterium]|nr:ABC transporter permease [Synergistaceae bacterium]